MISRAPLFLEVRRKDRLVEHCYPKMLSSSLPETGKDKKVNKKKGISRKNQEKKKRNARPRRSSSPRVKIIQTKR